MQAPITAALQGAPTRPQRPAPPQPAPAMEQSNDSPQQQMPQQQLIDESGEGAALAAAIQRLVGERDQHRHQVVAQHAEIMGLRSANDELRKQNEAVTLLRDHYLRLVTEMLGQLKQIDSAITASVQKSLEATDQMQERESTLVSLARRLTPNRGAAKSE